MSDKRVSTAASAPRATSGAKHAPERDTGLVVLLADDQPLFRDGLSRLLHHIDRHAAILEAETLEDTLAVARANPAINLIFVAVGLPGSTDYGGLDEILRAAPQARVIVLSSTHDDGRIVQALTRGARGYVIRTSGREVVNLAVSLVLAGEVFVPSEAVDGFKHKTGGAENAAAADPVAELTARQRQVLQCMLKGDPNKEIARKLRVDETTIKTHVRSIMRKLGVANRTQAVLRAVQLGAGREEPA